MPGAVGEGYPLVERRRETRSSRTRLQHTISRWGVCVRPAARREAEAALAKMGSPGVCLASALIVAALAVCVALAARSYVARVVGRNRPPPGTQPKWASREVLNNVSGLPQPSFVTSWRIEELSNGSFDHRPSDIWVVAYPKSGTTWTQTIVGALLGHPIPGIAEGDQRLYCPWPERALGKRPLPMAELRARPAPRCLKSHWPARDHLARGRGRGRVVFVLRNVLDVAESYYHHYLDLRLFFDFAGGWDEFFAWFLAGDVGSGSYFDYVASWWPRRLEEDVLFLRCGGARGSLWGGALFSA